MYLEDECESDSRKDPAERQSPDRGEGECVSSQQTESRRGNQTFDSLEVIANSELKLRRKGE